MAGTKSAARLTVDPAMTVDAARALLKEVDLRCTSARIAVLQHMSSAEQPLSHAEVADQLENSVFDRSTVFRVLVELADAGLLTRLDIGDQVRRFEIKRKSRGVKAAKSSFEPLEHPHFVCVDCGIVTCLTDTELGLSSTLSRKTPIGTITEILLRGHCQLCLKKTTKAK